MLQRKYRPRLYVESAQERELLLSIEAAGVPTFRRSMPAIFAELRRCRRYEHALAVLACGLEAPAQPRHEATGPVTSDLLTFLLLGSMLQDVTRESDIVTYAVQERVYAVFLPESDEQAAHTLVRRLARAFFAHTAWCIRAGVAVFPNHGLIVDGLFDYAMRSHAHAIALPIDAAETTEEDDAWQHVRSAR